MQGNVTFPHSPDCSRVPGCPHVPPRVYHDTRQIARYITGEGRSPRPTTRPTIALAAFSGHLHHPGSGCTQGYAARRGDPGNPESADFFSSRLTSSCDTSSGDVRTCGLLYREVPANATGVTRGQSRSARSLMLLVCLAVLVWGIGDLLLESFQAGSLSLKTVASVLAARLTRTAVLLVTLPDSRTAPFLAALPIVLWLLARHTRRR